MIIGDSLLVGAKPNVEYLNKAVVGNTPIGVLKTIEKDIKDCTEGDILISIGSNVLFNKFSVEKERIKEIVKNKTKSIHILAIPANGRYRSFAKKYNTLFASIADSNDNIYFYPHIKKIEKYLHKDNIHLTYQGRKIWLSSLKFFQKRPISSICLIRRT